MSNEVVSPVRPNNDYDLRIAREHNETRDLVRSKVISSVMISYIIK